MYDDLSDLIRTIFPYYLLITLPILITIYPGSVNANEIAVQRMSQFDVQGVAFGCRASALNLEAKSLNTWSTSRHCVITRIQDLSIDQYREIRSKAGGLIVLFPKNFHSLSLEDKQHIYMLERAMLAQDISIPVYFSKFDENIDKVIDDVTKHRFSKDSKQESAFYELFNKISANGYQISVSGSSHQANKQSKIPIIQGELIPFKQINREDGPQQQINSNKLPSIIISANLKTFGLTNDYPTNYDSTIMLTLIDVFSKLYNQVQTTPKYRLIFLMSESASLLNFQGTKKWLELNLEDNTQIQNAEFVVCLDTISQLTTEIGRDLYMHVSKPPKEGTNMYKFYELLKQKAQLYGYENQTIEGVHKKINLAEPFLAWEHERFSMKRIAAFTISSLKSHTDPIRNTIFSEYTSTSTLQPDSVLDEELVDNLQRNAKILAEALAAYIFNINGDEVNESAAGEIFTGSMAIKQSTVKPYLNMRSMLKSNNIKLSFEKYLKNVKQFMEKPDPRDPDFMFYEGEEAKLNVYNVKPAVFDLFLTCLIAIYLCGIYLVVLHFPKLYTFVCKLTYNPKTETNGTNNVNHKVKSN
jgi:hypothetical protein